MFGTQTQKVVAIQAASGMEGKIAIPEATAQQAVLESLYIYGVLLQLHRYGEIEYRDWATTRAIDKKHMDAHHFEEGRRRQLKQFCESARAQYCFFVETALQDQTLTIRYYFYESTATPYKLTQGDLEADLGSGLYSPETVNAAAFNSLINETVQAILKVLPKSHAPSDGQLTPLCSHVGVLYSLLQAHWSTETSDKILYYQQAIQVDNTVESAYAHLGRIYRSNGDYAKSILCFRNALQVACGALRNRAVYATEGGISCALLGKNDVTLQWWNQAISYDPHYLNPYLNLGNLHEDLNQLDKAVEYFAQAAKLAPDDSRTFSSLARLYSKQGKWEKALGQYTHQLDVDGEDAWCHSDIATCHLNLGNPVAAIEHLKRTAALDPGGEAGQYAELILEGLQASQDTAYLAS
jgi:tetratricopeptide (TPR) repeat protein